MAIIQTVGGAIAPEALGRTLIHEHLMVDFIGAAETGPHRWDRDEVVATMRPYLDALRERGFTGFVDCTPAYLGRDVRVLEQLSDLTGLHILTNTGLYKAPHLPAFIDSWTPAQLAEVWVREWEEGIEGTGIRPGLVKIAVNPGPLEPIQQTIVRAAAITHRATGLTVAAHTAHAVAARQSLDLIEAEGMDPEHYIIVHADQIDEVDCLALAHRGAWLEYDAIGTRPVEEHAQRVLAIVDEGYEDQLLISQDAGWYNVGQPGGGVVRPYTVLSDEFVPALMAAGADAGLIDRLLIDNPRRALAVTV